MIIAPHRDNHKKIVILNPKGGCGKTTLATNLASYFALRGPAPTLIDTDPRGYTTRWLERRPADRARINAIPANSAAPLRAHRNSGTLIIDTPAGLDRRTMSELTHDADCILVPILPSAFDVHATTNFIAALLLLTDFERPVAVVANRTRQKTRSLAMLMRVLANFETPTVAVMRDSQNYVLAAELGLGIYELPRHRVKQDIELMQPLLEWIDQHTTESLQPGFMARFNPIPRLFTRSNELSSGEPRA